MVIIFYKERRLKITGNKAIVKKTIDDKYGSEELQFEGKRIALSELKSLPAIDFDKQADLKVVGQNTEVDSSILNRIIAPLEHLVRNAISHGIEDAAHREEANKDKILSVAFEIPLGDNKVLNAILHAPDIFAIQRAQKISYQTELARLKEDEVDKLEINEDDWNTALDRQPTPEARKRMESTKPKNLAE